jgi:hypothetical protein
LLAAFPCQVSPRWRKEQKKERTNRTKRAAATSFHKEIASVPRFLLAGLLGVLLLLASGGGAPLLAAPTKADHYRGADELAARVDRLMDAAWKKANITPARAAADAEWLRRVYLDLTGRIPSVTEARSFLGDRRADKRKRKVESLLDGPRYPTWFAAVWRGLLLPESNATIQVRVQAPTFEQWLRNHLASENGFDALVRELITAPTDALAGQRFFSASAAGIFYSAKENKPEELAAAIAQVFLGVNLGCAQCHNHPFAKWKREQFWSFAAFFSVRGRDPRREDGRRRRPAVVLPGELTIPGTQKVVKAKYLDGKALKLTDAPSIRQALADWMTASDNPLFARALVNRLWAQLFGTGLVEPLDEMVGADRMPSHPDVLDDLAGAFAKQKYDLRWLIRAITSTRAYQLSSARSHASQDDPKQFARAALRGLTAEQLFDSLAQATGFRDETPARGRALFASSAAREEFLTKFASSERATEAQTSILQALTLMNGRFMSAVTSVRRSETLQAIADAPFLDVPGKIKALFLATLSREPTSKELARLVRYVEKSGEDDIKRVSRDLTNRQSEALADVFWALLNSAEFVLNH